MLITFLTHYYLSTKAYYKHLYIKCHWLNFVFWNVFPGVLFYQCNISCTVQQVLQSFSPTAGFVSVFHWQHALHNLVCLLQQQWGKKRTWHSLNSHHVKRPEIFCLCTLRKERQVLWWKIHISNRAMQAESDKEGAWERQSKKRTERQTEIHRGADIFCRGEKENVLFIQKVRMRACCFFSCFLPAPNEVLCDMLFDNVL